MLNFSKLLWYSLHLVFSLMVARTDLHIWYIKSSSIRICKEMGRIQFLKDPCNGWTSNIANLKWVEKKEQKLGKEFEEYSFVLNNFIFNFLNFCSKILAFWWDTILRGWQEWWDGIAALGYKKFRNFFWSTFC